MTSILVLSSVVLSLCCAHAAMDNPHRMVLKSSSFPRPRFFPQKQDHFDGDNDQHWQQAYYVNDTFWSKAKDAPVFLCVGGEGPPLDGSVVVASPHCNNAVEWLQDTGALMFAIEHRYYGCHNDTACPIDPNDRSTPLHEKLKFLSSKQALFDVMRFVDFAEQEYGLVRGSNKWVSFGGSYPGMLAGWSRLKFPHLIHAAVASSAPVQAQLDMPEYNNIVSDAFEEADVGGSKACRDAIFDGHQAIGKMINNKSGRTSLVKLFELGYHPTELAKPDVQEAFCGNGVAVFPAQANDPHCPEPACNIEKICNIMLSGEQPHVEKLAAVAKAQKQGGNVAPLAVQSRRRLGAKSELMENLWQWQTCTEFGFYQTCEVGSKCFYTQGIVTLDTYIRMCVDTFGVSKERVKEAIQESNLFYGGRNPAGSRVMYPNGSVDPWKGLSILKSPNNEAFPTLMVKGSSHHHWTYPSEQIFQESVMEARTVIRKQVAEWLRHG